MRLFAKKETLTIKVSGMKCIHCAKKVKDALKKHHVKSEVDLENNNVTVTYDLKKISIDKIKEIINELGFTC